MAPDLLGFGFSAKPPRHRYRIAEQADLCLATLSAARVDSCSILAHDYGDTVAQELVARANEGRNAVELRSVVFLNGGLFPETHRALLTQRLLRTPLGPLLAAAMTKQRLARTMRHIAGETPPGDDEIDAFWSLLNFNAGRRALPSLIGYIDERREQRARWVGALERTSIPITLVVGLADPISGAHMVRRFRQLVTSAAVVELPRVGHYPQLEAPAAVVAAALSAFKRAT